MPTPALQDVSCGCHGAVIPKVRRWQMASVTLKGIIPVTLISSPDPFKSESRSQRDSSQRGAEHD